MHRSLAIGGAGGTLGDLSAGAAKPVHGAGLTDCGQTNLKNMFLHHPLVISSNAGCVQRRLGELQFWAVNGAAIFNVNRLFDFLANPGGGRAPGGSNISRSFRSLKVMGAEMCLSVTFFY